MDPDLLLFCRDQRLGSTIMQWELRTKTSRKISIQLFSNPSSGNATLLFSLNRHSPVRIDIVSMDGILKIDLLNSTMAAGTHSFAVATSSIPPGLYLIRTVINDHVIVKKLAVL
jgi:hypothetical protein